MVIDISRPHQSKIMFRISLLHIVAANKQVESQQKALIPAIPKAFRK